ncbi:DUF2515 family protein [Cohnella silvisoli]|uniref:DUF2515 family protein n=1 Tax=Cohnella silvisoli TaxID=2873699 RepID=A0ABV1KWN0_9BACL|nr:DUF2515 family protein [Cohnella silvisoli]MCD9023936.1 DUF2515 domain-containing protein [Cohnella silvisoli]
MENKAEKSSGAGLPNIFNMPWQLISGAAGKINGLWHSYRLTRRHTPLPLDEKLPRQLTSLFETSISSDHSFNGHSLHAEVQLCTDIRNETVKLNKNNITRTMAYWDIFKAHPELHWALLAHLVSRNGGWSMTDLKGQWLSHLLSDHLVASIFDMLEACNSLIFGDAYPQLRLYAESKRSGRNLTYLLPEFGVSSFMPPFWNNFWQDGNPVPLTEALIINEQSFIQSRVVEDDRYRRDVFSSLAFRSQPLMQLNQIIFPLWRAAKASRSMPMRLAGRVLENFENVQERIEFGKGLYGMLFGYPTVLHKAAAFAAQVAHTGSRADYWPHRFTSESKTEAGGKPEKSDLAAGRLLCSGWLSPSLSDAWPDKPIIPAKEKDWFGSLEALNYLKTIKLPRVIDMTHEHLLGQNKLQTAVLLERSFMNGARRRRTGRG